MGQRGSVRSWSLEGEIAAEDRRKITPNAPDLESCHNLLLNINNELISIDNNHNIHFITGNTQKQGIPLKATPLINNEKRIFKILEKMYVFKISVSARHGFQKFVCRHGQTLVKIRFSI